MFSLDERKQHTYIITHYIEKKLGMITNNRYINGYILLLVHWILTLIPLVYLFIGNINNIYYFCAFIWTMVFVFHFYFKGCIITRVERSLWKEKNWWGPWLFLFRPLEKIGICMNDELANRIFILWGVSIILTVLYRLTCYYKLK